MLTSIYRNASEWAACVVPWNSLRAHRLGLCVWLMSRDGGAVLSRREAEEGRLRTSDLRSHACLPLWGSGAASLIRAAARRRGRVFASARKKEICCFSDLKHAAVWKRGGACVGCARLASRLKQEDQRQWRFGNDGRRRRWCLSHSRCWRLLQVEPTSGCCKLSLLCSHHRHLNCIPPSWSTPTDDSNDDNKRSGVLNCDFTFC